MLQKQRALEAKMKSGELSGCDFDSDDSEVDAEEERELQVEPPKKKHKSTSKKVSY